VDRLYPLTVVTPKATPIGAPQATPWPLEDANLLRVEITVPSGHNGLTGIRLLWANQQVIPFGNNSYLVANDRTIVVEFNDYMTASGLVVGTYNTDIYDHSHYLLATITDTASARVSNSQAGSGAAILPAPTVTAPDPLGPDALLASLPPDVASNILAGIPVGAP
jgi:hypothetical protein